MEVLDQWSATSGPRVTYNPARQHPNNNNIFNISRLFKSFTLMDEIISNKIRTKFLFKIVNPK